MNVDWSCENNATGPAKLRDDDDDDDDGLIQACSNSDKIVGFTK